MKQHMTAIKQKMPEARKTTPVIPFESALSITAIVLKIAVPVVPISLSITTTDLH